MRSLGSAHPCADSVRPLSCILARRACSVGFASCETWGKHYHASLRLRSFGSLRPCSDFVRPLSCIHCTFMNALWALRPCKAFGRSFYKASVPYPQNAGSPSRHTKNNTPLNERGIILVPMAGVEPARYCYQRILSPSRLPIPSHRLINVL